MATIDLSELKGRLKYLRMLLGLTGAQMATDADVPLHMIKTVEQGVTLNPGYQFVQRIVKRYNVNGNWFLLNDGDVFSANPDLERQVQQQTAALQDKDAIIQALNRALANLKGKLRRESQKPGVPEQPGIFSGFWPRQRLHAVTPRA